MSSETSETESQYKQLMCLQRFFFSESIKYITISIVTLSSLLVDTLMLRHWFVKPRLSLFVRKSVFFFCCYFRESDITKERIQKILASGANVVLTTGGIDDMCLKYFVDVGAMAVRRVLKRDLKRIAKATGGTRLFLAF